MYGDKVNTNFQDKAISNKNTAYKCLSLIILDSLVRANKKYYSNTLEECKYEIKRTKMENLINDDLEPTSSDDETQSNSDNESDKEFDNQSDNK